MTKNWTMHARVVTVEISAPMQLDVTTITRVITVKTGELRVTMVRNNRVKVRQWLNSDLIASFNLLIKGIQMSTQQC